jgi:RNA polymerase sigma-70 factor (ECF subfamily)
MAWTTKEQERMASPAVLSSFEFNATYLHSLRQGDPSTEEHFVSHFGPILQKKLRRKVRSTDQISDIRQETFLRVLTILRTEQGVRHPERFEILVLGVCNNVLREVYRQQKRVVQLPADFDLPDSFPNPAQWAIAGESGNYVWKVLARLDPDARAILQAALLEEQDREAICRRFGISRNHLRLLIHRAKKTFAIYIQKEMGKRPNLAAHGRSKPHSRVLVMPRRRPAVARNLTPPPMSALLLPIKPAEVPSECWA